MRLEADRMTGLVLDDKVVLPERDVVLEERRMRIDNEPASCSPSSCAPRFSCTIRTAIRRSAGPTRSASSAPMTRCFVSEMVRAQ